MSETNDKTTGAFRSLDGLVLFLSDVCWFVKGWRPIKITWEEPLKTKMRWRMARKRRDIKKAILEKKKQNARRELRKN